MTSRHALSSVPPAPYTAAEDRQGVAVFTADVPARARLRAGLVPGVEAVFLPSATGGDACGLGQAMAALVRHRADKAALPALHLFCHGAPGRLFLGHTALSLDTLDAHRGTLARLGALMAPDANVVLYACAVAQGATGTRFVAALEAIIGRPVAASATPTGAAALGGDWDWAPAFTPNVPLALPLEARASYPGLLAFAPNGTTTWNSVTAAVNASGNGSASFTYSINNGTDSGDLVVTAVADGGGTVGLEVKDDDGADGSDGQFNPFGNASGDNFLQTARTGFGVTNGLDYVEIAASSGVFDLDSFRLFVARDSVDGTPEAFTIRAYSSGAEVGTVTGSIIEQPGGDYLWATVDTSGSAAFDGIDAFRIDLDNSVRQINVDDITISNAGAGVPAPTITTPIEGDGLINAAEDGDVEIAGTANANATVDVSISDGSNPAVTAQVTANGAGTWTLAGGNELDVSGLDDGALTVSVTQTDGGTSPAATEIVTLDKTPPSAPAITTPIEGDGIVNAAEDGDVVIAGTAEANATVDVSISDGSNPAVTAQVTANGAGTWTLAGGNELDISGLDEGALTVSVTQTDAAGNTSTAATEALTLDTAAPAAPVITTPIEGDGLVNAAEDADMVVAGTAEANATVDVSVSDGSNPAVTGQVTANGAGTWTLAGGNELDISGLDEGALTVAATQTDAAGNISTAATETVTLDTTAPGIASVSTNLAGDLITDAAVGTDSLVITVDFDQPVNTGVMPSVTFPTENPANTLTTPADIAFVDADTLTLTYDVADANEVVADVDLQLTGVQDAAGNSASPTAADAFSIITAPAPTIQSITSTTPNGSYGVGDAIALTVTFDEAVDFTANGGTLRVALDTGATVTLANADAPNQTSFTASYTIQEGQTDSVDLTVTAVDLTGGATLTANDDGVPADRTPPALANLDDNADLVIDANTPATPGAPDLLAAGDSGVSDSDDITATATAAVSGTTETGATVTVRVGGAPVGSTTADGAGAWSFSFAPGDLSQGANTVDAVVTDGVNTSADGADLTLTLDTVAPTAVADTGAVNEDDGSSALANVAGNDTGVSGSAPVSAVDGSPGNLGGAVAGDNGGLFTVAADGSASFDPDGAFEALAAGDTDTSSVTLTLQDDAGNTDTATLTVTITGQNDAPTGADGARSVGAGQVIAIAASDLGFADPDTGDSLAQITVDTVPVDGTLFVDGQGGGTIDGTADGEPALVATDTVASADLTAGRLLYEAPGTDGARSLDFTVNDGDTDAVAGNTLTLTVDATAPDATAIARQTPSTATTSADSLTFRVSFNEDVQNVDASDFIATGTTATPAAVSAVAADTYDVTVSGGNLADLNGTVGLAFSGGQDIQDLAGNAFAGGAPATDEAYSVSNTAPPPPDDDLFTGDDNNGIDDDLDTGLNPTDTFESVDIDGAPATRGTTTDRDTGETVDVIALQPTEGRNDKNQTSADVDVEAGQGILASVSDNTGLLLASRVTGSRAALTTVLSRPEVDEPGAPADPELTAFLDDAFGAAGASGPGDALSAPLPVVELTPVGGSEGDGRRLAVDVSGSTGQGDDDTGRPVVVVDLRTIMAGDGTSVNDAVEVTISGSAAIVVRGSGWFTGGAEELADDDRPDRDVVLGDDSAQRLFFGPGDDIIRARGGDDQVGSAGGSDRLFGGAGDDILAGGADADALFGGDGTDTADYRAASGPVTVRLWRGTGQGNDAEGDKLVGIENVIGSGFDDVLVGA
ncbi:hypothetical protein CCR85_03455, partial [Rhodothalassium salexigens]|uniref:DUF4347 domain-containing protein n=1 Tax=Rhodothalassium salexigens TaxID=1086 RepID=UPI001F5E08D6